MSRAECPGASTRASQSRRYVPWGPSTRTPVSIPSPVSRPVSRWPKRTSHPRAMSSWRMRFTTWRRMSVPMWGLWDHFTSAGAPAPTRASITAEMRGSWVPVVNFPSEKVPAPPSPNCTLEAGSSAPPGPEALHLGGAGIHVLAPLQHHAGNAVPGQEQGGKQPRRPHPHHHGHGPRAALHLREHIGLGGYQGDIFLPGPLHRLLLSASQGYVHGVHVVHVLFLPGVDGLPDQNKVLQRSGAHPQGLGRPPA